MECICESCARKDCKERTKQDDLRIVIACEEYLKHKATNADRIRAMSDEELATFLADDDRVCPPVKQNCSRHVHDCVGCHLAWLKQPAKEE